MIRSGYPYFNKKLLFDRTTTLLHNLQNEKEECGIDSIDHEDIDMYSSLNEASLLLDHPVYKLCPHCMNVKDEK